MFNKDHRLTKSAKIGIITSGSALLPMILFFTFYFHVVDVGQTGILVRFGQVQGQVGSGITITDPFETVVSMNVQTQKDNVQAGAATQDLQQLDTNVNFNYHLTPKTAFDVYKKVGVNYDSILIQPDIQEVVKANTAHYNASELITKRSDVETAIFNDLQAKLAPLGVTADSLSILDFGFSADYNKAIEQKQVSQQQAQQAQYDLQTAQLKSQAQQVQAATLTPEYLQLQAINKWDGHTPQYLGANNVFGIPLGK